MRKLLLFILSIVLLAALSHSAMGQSFNGIQWDDYNISGDVIVSNGNKSIKPDTCAAFQIGKDTTTKGLLLPRVVDTVISNAKKGLIIYRLLDGKVYVYNGVQWSQIGSGSGSAFDTTYLYTQLAAKQAKSDTNTYDATKYWVLSNYQPLGSYISQSDLDDTAAAIRADFPTATTPDLQAVTDQGNTTTNAIESSNHIQAGEFRLENSGNILRFSGAFLTGTHVQYPADTGGSIAIISPDITDGKQKTAPSEDAVYDALATKMNAPSGIATDGYVVTLSSGTPTWLPPVGVSDGDKGDITVSGGGTVWTVDDGMVHKSATVSGLSTGSVVMFTTENNGRNFRPFLCSVTCTSVTGTASGTFSADIRGSGAGTANFIIGVAAGNAVLGRAVSINYNVSLVIAPNTDVILNVSGAQTGATVLTYRVDMFGFYQ